MTDATDWTWGDVEVTPRTDTVWICLDGEAATARDLARRELRAAQQADDSIAGPDADLVERAAAAEERVAAATRPFTVVALPYHEWQELIDAHAAGKPKDSRWNATTFLPASFAACVAQIPDVDAAIDAIAKLDTAQVGKLFKGVLAVNEGDDPVPSG